MSNTILLPVDASPCARAAARYALENILAAEAEFDVRLMHVLHAIPPRAASAVGRDIVEGYYRSETQRAFGAVCRRFDAAKIHYQRVVKIGDAGAAIAQYARTRNADLIVMGTHGRGAATQLLLGSATQGVLAVPGAPVLVVPRRSTPDRRREIMLAVDGSPQSRSAAEFLARRVQWFPGNQRVALVHVIDTPQMFPFGMHGHAQQKFLQSESERIMGPLRSIFSRAGIEHREICLHGDPADVLGALIRRRHPRLLVMGCRGHGPIRALILGSLTQAMIRQRKTPILIAH
jgi:nucleotide-binding universal stress UspA family protein